MIIRDDFIICFSFNMLQYTAGALYFAAWSSLKVVLIFLSESEASDLLIYKVAVRILIKDKPMIT